MRSDVVGSDLNEMLLSEDDGNHKAFGILAVAGDVSIIFIIKNMELLVYSLKYRFATI